MLNGINGRPPRSVPGGERRRPEGGHGTRRDSAEDRVVGYQHAAESGVGGVIYHAHHHDYTSRATLAEALSGRVGNWSDRASTHYAANRVLATPTRRDVTNGSYVFQAGSGAFTAAADGAEDWTLSRDVTGMRRFSMNVTRETLADPASTDTLSDLTDADPFQVEVSNGSATAEVLVYEQDYEVVVRVVSPSGELLPGSCSATGDHVTVGITVWRVGGKPCEPLEFPRVTGAYDISYRNGDAIDGRYGLVTDVLDAAGGVAVGPGLVLHSRISRRSATSRSISASSRFFIAIPVDRQDRVPRNRGRTSSATPSSSQQRGAGAGAPGRGAPVAVL